MAVLKMWDGSAWVPVGAGAPAVASPLTVSAGGVLDIQQASASLEGSMSAADFARVQHIHEVGASPTVLFQSEQGNAYVTGKRWGYVGGNLDIDASNFLRFDTGFGSIALALEPILGGSGRLHLYDAPTGANPATLTERLSVSPQGSIEQITTPGNAPLLTGNGVLHLASNLYYDGTNWQRYNTGAHSILIRVGSDSGTIDVYYAAPGANPATLTGYTWFNVAARPPIAYTALGTYLAYASGWSAYNGGLAPYGATISRDPLGYVHIHGLVAKSSAITNGETIGTLAANLWPRDELIYPCMSAGGAVEVRVLINGKINVQTSFATSNTWISLAGIGPYYAYA